MRKRDEYLGEYVFTPGGHYDVEFPEGVYSGHYYRGRLYRIYPDGYRRFFFIFDDDVDGHDGFTCPPLCEDGHGWYFDEAIDSCFRKVNKIKTIVL